MRIALASAASCAILAAFTAGSAAAPGQDRVPIPGMMTQGKVWIQNAGQAEAIPVTIERMGTESTPLRVQVIGVTPVAIAPGTAVQTQAQAVRQQWDHRTVAVAAGQDAAAALASAGAEGWEAVGLQAGPQGGSVILMKRPR